MTADKKIYMVTFPDKKSMEKFAGLPPEDTKVRCIFKKKNAVSVEAGKTGFCKMISEGLLPEDCDLEPISKKD